MKFRRAFTFLELMLALLIVTIVAGAVSLSLVTAFKARDGIVNSLEPMRQASTAIEFMRRDLESALPPSGYIANTFTDGNTGSDSVSTHDLVFVAAVDAPKNMPGYLQTDVRTVEYLILPDPDDAKDNVLYRRISSNSYALTVNGADPPIDAELLCRGVRAFDITYYDGTLWNPTWDSTQQTSVGVSQYNILPYAVEIKMELNPVKAGGQPIQIDRVIQLPCAVPATQPTTGMTP